MTLVELMVALGLTSLVALALFSLAQTQTTLGRQTQQAQRLQDNLRASMEELASSVRRAGRSFNAGVVANAVPPGSPQWLPAVRVINSSGAPDQLQLLMIEESPLLSLMATADATSTQLLVDSGSGAMSFQPGSFVVLSNFNRGTLYQLTAAPTMVVLSGVSVDRLPVMAPAFNPGVTYAPGALVTRARLIGYSIDTTSLSGLPALALQDGAPLVTGSPELVAELIEDMQVAVAVDGLLSGSANQSLQEQGAAANDDEWVYNFPGEVMPDPLPAGAVLTAVRITLVARGAQAETGAPGTNRPAAEDRPAGTADGFQRRVLTTTVMLRSLSTN